MLPRLLYGKDAYLYLDPNILQSQWSEGNDTGLAPITHPIYEGDAVGTITDLSKGAHLVNTPTTRRQTLTFNSGRNALWAFESSKYFNVLNSLNSFECIYSGRSATIAVPVKKRVDGTDQVIFGSIGADDDSMVGFLLRLTSANKVKLVIGKGSSGTPVASFTSTATVTVADGLVWIIFTLDGTSGNFYKYINGAYTNETFSLVAGAAAGTAANYILRIGMVPNSTNFWGYTGYLGTCLIHPQPLPVNDLNTIAAWNPAVSQADVVATLDDNGTPASYSHLYAHFEGDDPNYLWQDTGYSTPADTDEDRIRIIENRTGRHFKRDLLAASDALRAYFYENLFNGQPALGFEAANALDMADFNFPDFDIFVVGQNDSTDSVVSSGAPRVLSGNQYFGFAGVNYHENSETHGGEPFSYFHTASQSPPQPHLINPTGINIYRITKHGARVRMRINGVRELDWTDGMTQGFSVTRIGGGSSDRFLQGSLTAVLFYTGAMSDEQAGRIEAYLGNKYGVPNVEAFEPLPIAEGGTGAITAAAARTALGLGTAATEDIGDFAAASHTHTSSAITDFDVAAEAVTDAILLARIGADIQAYDTGLASLAGLTNAQGDILYATANNTFAALAKDTNATRYLSNTGSSNNPAWAQVNLSNGVTGTLPIANGGTGITTATPRSIVLTVVNPEDDTEAGDGQVYIPIPAALNGYVITSVFGEVITAGTTGTTDLQIARIRSGTPVDVLSTKLTIDSGETDSSTATPAVINTSNDDLATGDKLRIDIDAVSTTPAKGYLLTIELTK